MNIIYETKDIVIIEKSVGISSQHTQKGDGLSDILKEKYGYASVINRLDTVVGGLIIFAKNQKSASYLSKLSQEREIDKTYLAVVEGIPQEKEGIFEDLLYKDSSKNKSFVVKRMRKGVKKASLEYVVKETVECDGKNLSLVMVKLHTGRTHQIRVQFSSRKMPLLGDGKYGSRDNRCNVSLWSHKLKFKLSPKAAEEKFTSFPPKDTYPWNLFNFSDE